MKPRHRQRRSTSKKGPGKLTPRRKVMADRRRSEAWPPPRLTADFDQFAEA